MRRSRHRFALAALSCLLSATAVRADDGVGVSAPVPKEIFTMICWHNYMPVLTYPNLTSFRIGQGAIDAETADGWRLRLVPPPGFSLEHTVCTLDRINVPQPRPKPG